MRITKSWVHAHGSVQVVLKMMRSGAYRLSLVRLSTIGDRVYSMKPATVLSSEHFLDAMSTMEPLLRMYRQPILLWIAEHLK